MAKKKTEKSQPAPPIDEANVDEIAENDSSDDSQPQSPPTNEQDQGEATDPQEVVAEQTDDAETAAEPAEVEQTDAAETIAAETDAQQNNNEQGSPPPNDSDSQEEVMPLPDFSDMLADAAASSIELLNDVELKVKIELGRVEMTVDEILKLATGSIVELDKLAGDPVDILVNEQLVARGEVLVVNDTFCVRINEIIKGVTERVTQE